jgi:fructose-bisphosphate aldolase class I
MVPWPFTFSYARALQEPALAVWQGKNENFSAGQAAFLQTLQANTTSLTSA